MWPVGKGPHEPKPGMGTQCTGGVLLFSVLPLPPEPAWHRGAKQSPAAPGLYLDLRCPMQPLNNSKISLSAQG